MVVACAGYQPNTIGPDLKNGATKWELALVTAPSFNGSVAAASKLVIILQYFLYSFLLLSCIESLQLNKCVKGLTLLASFENKEVLVSVTNVSLIELNGWN